ncbi:MAG: lysophospholipid acyltransferase family protein, partial [Chloroflexi bacterium]|nr:lysophospholipid acyltransferase family protein [Chloroflexota bacterium]
FSRRRGLRARALERAGVFAYRATAAVVGRVPEAPAARSLGWVTQAAYLCRPARRYRANENFGHVLGLAPDHPDVRSLALAAYRNYARYLVELMHLPRKSLEEASARVEPLGIETLEGEWRASGGLILAVAHVGNNEYVAAGMASRGWPISVLADDSSFPEMFELLRRQRERWGVRIIGWRAIREIYAVLRRGEILALLVDWGYRADGIPVRLFDAWTTLPAGPAVLAARSGAAILPIAVRRRPDGTFFVTHDAPIRVASTEAPDVRRATQQIAGALERVIGAAPDQWYSFKPTWPPTPAAVEEPAPGHGGTIGPPVAADATSAREHA